MPSPRLRHEAIFLLVFALDLVNMFIATVAYPALAAELHADVGLLAWVGTAYMLGLSVVIPLAPWLAARCGERRLLLVALLLPDAAPLLGMFCFGNLMRESGVVERLSDTVQNGLINIVTIFLGLSVGAKLVADKFLQPQTLGILVLGVIAFCGGTAAGVLMAKLLNLCSRNKINPLIGSAGVSAVPMAARVSNKVGLESDAQNFLLMHAMGPNVAGVIGSAIAAGVMLKYVLAM